MRLVVYSIRRYSRCCLIQRTLESHHPLNCVLNNTHQTLQRSIHYSRGWLLTSSTVLSKKRLLLHLDDVNARALNGNHSQTSDNHQDSQKQNQVRKMFGTKVFLVVILGAVGKSSPILLFQFTDHFFHFS